MSHPGALPDNGSMRRRFQRRPIPFVVVALALVVGANVGLQVHSGIHIALGASHVGATALSIAGHGAPDRSLHLDHLAETRFLACPGCQAQCQLGGADGLDLLRLERPAVAMLEAVPFVEGAKPLAVSGLSARAPPSC